MLKHDNLWGANPDTAEEMDEIERRRKKAMRTALLLLALVVALNVVINEFFYGGLFASKGSAAAPVAQQPEPSGQGAGGGEPALSLVIDADQAAATRVDQDAARAYVSAVLVFPSAAASSYLEVELLDSDGAKAADVGVAYSLDYGTCTVVPLESLTGGSEPPERIERGGDAL